MGEWVCVQEEGRNTYLLFHNKLTLKVVWDRGASALKVSALRTGCCGSLVWQGPLCDCNQATQPYHTTVLWSERYRRHVEPVLQTWCESGLNVLDAHLALLDLKSTLTQLEVHGFVREALT